MRAYRKVAVHFGMVSIPVGVYKAVDSHDISFKQHHGGPDGCGEPVGMKRVCKGCEREVDYADIVKGCEAEDGTIVLAAPEEIKSLEGETVSGIEVISFIDAGEIDPLAYESSYYLAPDKTGGEGYALLKHVMVESSRAALVRFAFTAGRESLGLLRPAGKTLVLHTLAWPDEIREPAFAILDKPVKLKPAMIEAARTLVDAMTEPYVAADHVDVYTDKVREFIAVKAAGGDYAPAKVEAEPAVDDLLAALEATIAKKKKAAKPRKKTAAA